MRKPDLSKLSFSGGVPTMIVPPGTQIQVDAQGDVSIRTPGNLVLQNSGAYGVLESVSGSIRVEPGVHVEAVTVRCADTCFVQGTPVHAPAEAVVVFAGRYDLRQNVSWWRYGNLVVLRHDDRFVTLFGHLEAVDVKAGQRVDQGQVIGRVGNTGWSTSPHLHYEVRRFDAGDFRPVDPRIYILDHRWRDEERLLVRARTSPDPGNYEPLPQRLSR